MKDNAIFIHAGEISHWAEKGAILVPSEVEAMQTLVKPIIPGGSASAKNVAYSLIQIALSSFEEGELEMVSIDPATPIVAVKNDEAFTCLHGIMLFWTNNGIKLYGHQDAKIGNLLKIAHRECTRWIRLDVK